MAHPLSYIHSSTFLWGGEMLWRSTTLSLLLDSILSPCLLFGISVRISSISVYVFVVMYFLSMSKTLIIYWLRVCGQSHQTVVTYWLIMIYFYFHLLLCRIILQSRDIEMDDSSVWFSNLVHLTEWLWYCELVAVIPAWCMRLFSIYPCLFYDCIADVIISLSLSVSLCLSTHLCTCWRIILHSSSFILSFILSLRHLILLQRCSLLARVVFSLGHRFLPCFLPSSHI